MSEDGRQAGREQGSICYRAGRYAAIDIGTVTARLLVADVSADGTITELHRDTDICNLGVGVDKTGELNPDAIKRVSEVVSRFVDAIESLQPAEGAPIEVTANSTSASRDAKNSGEFVDALAKLGVELSVIPGEKEAALSFAGASSAFPGQKVIVLDVGGGSSEIIAGYAGDTPTHATSFDIGCRRVTERFLHDDPPTAGQLDTARRWIAETMHDYLQDLIFDGYSEHPIDDGDNDMEKLVPCRVIAVAGTATSAVSMRERMKVYDSQRVHGATVTRDDIDELLNHLASLNLEERKQVVGLNPDRAPVIVAGMLILQQIMRLLGADFFTVSERDILHGIILDASQG